MASWWPARKSEPCQDAATTVNTITVGAACLPGHPAPGACTWYHQVLPGSTRHLPGAYQVQAPGQRVPDRTHEAAAQ